MRMPIAPGLEAAIEHIVGPADTAAALHSGDVAVLGTPKVVALCEQAAVLAIAGELSEGETSVGTTMDIAHVAPTPLGRHVDVHARLESIEGRTLHFAFVATDETGPIARGTHTRVVVERERFLRGAQER